MTTVVERIQDEDKRAVEVVEAMKLAAVSLGVVEAMNFEGDLRGHVCTDGCDEDYDCPLSEIF